MSRRFSSVTTLLWAEGLRFTELGLTRAKDVFGGSVSSAAQFPLALRVNAEGRRKNAERGVAPVQPAVFILHSAFCIHP